MAWAGNIPTMEALCSMNRNQVSRLMVVEDNGLLGVISLKDMLNFIAHKVDLGSP
jgi:signal-transduction protein with cAMP-binding, CBS, and nucleotidyltransferase domain